MVVDFGVVVLLCCIIYNFPTYFSNIPIDEIIPGDVLESFWTGFRQTSKFFQY